MQPEDREDRLPVWAKDKLRSLREAVRLLDAERKRLTSETPTRVYSENRGGVDGVVRTYLNERDSVVFEEAGVQVQYNNDGHLAIYGKSSLLIGPSSSNLITVRSAEWREWDDALRSKEREG